MNNELYHHGIKGQRWGFRRFQNPDGTLTDAGKLRYGYIGKDGTVKAGTVVYRSSLNKNENNTGHAYLSVSNIDRAYYTGGSGANWLRNTAGKTSKDPLYEHSFKLKRDIKVATKEDITKVYEDLAKKDKRIDKGNIDFVINNNLDNDVEEAKYSYEERKLDFEYFKSQGNKELAKYAMKDVEKSKKEYESVVKDLVKRYGDMPADDRFLFGFAGRIGGEKDIQEKVFKELQKRGFDGMVDYASVGDNRGRIEGVAPLIVFDRSDTLQEKKVKKVGTWQARKAAQEYYRWLSDEKGKRDRGERERI